MNIDTIILCGGLGKRLRAELGEKQKTMANVNGHPFLDFLLQYLNGQGLRRVILCTGFQADEVEQYYRKGPSGIEIVFSRENEPLGTGGAIKNAASLVKSDPFFALNGDSFCSLDYEALLKFHQNKKALASLALSPLKEKSDFGSVDMDEARRITVYQEKAMAGNARFASVGAYCFNKQIFALMPAQKNFSIERDFFPKLIGKAFYGIEVQDPFWDIGTPERLEQAKKELRKIYR